MSMSVKVILLSSTGVDDNRISYAIYVLDSENISELGTVFSGPFLINGHHVPIRQEHKT